MTKKRFIKLLMSHGKQPREARMIALRYNARGMSYKKAYNFYYAETSLMRAILKIGKVSIKLGDSITNAAQSLKKFTEASREQPIRRLTPEELAKIQGLPNETERG